MADFCWEALKQVSVALQAEHHLPFCPLCDVTTVLKSDSLSIKEPRTHAKGRLADFFDNEDTTAKCHVSHAFEAIIGELQKRSSFDENIPDVATLVGKKGMGKAEFTRLLKRMELAERLKCWNTVEAQLINDGLDIITLQRYRRSWETYEIQRIKARTIKFHPKTMVITGDNDTGKSSIIKSIFRCFGAEPPIHSNWKEAAVSLLLTFDIGGTEFSILRQANQFVVFDQQGLPIEIFRSVTTGLGPFLAKLLGFGLKLVSQQNESVTPPPAYYLLPFYFDQDRSWTDAWRAFERLEQMKSWKTDLVEYHTGIRPNAFYEMRGEQTGLTKERDNHQSELEVVRQIRNELSEKLQAVSFHIDIEAFREEITQMLVECEKVQQTAEKVRERLVAFHNDRMNIEAQIEIVKGSLKELNADYEFLRRQGDHVECPTCGAEYQSHFQEVFDIAVDEDKCEDLLITLNDQLENVKRKIQADSAIHNKHEVEAARIRALLATRKEEVQLKDLIESESKQQVSGVLSAKLETLNRVLIELETKLNEIKRKLKELTSRERREAINESFRGFMREYLFLLAVQGMGNEKYRNVTARIAEQGSDLPRALLAYRFAILQVMRQYSSSVYFPVVIDSPIQQEQDKDNHQRILEFIRDHRPSNAQVIIGVVDTKGIEFGGGTLIVTEKRNVLRSEEYEAAYSELEPYIQHSVMFMEGGLSQG